MEMTIDYTGGMQFIAETRGHKLIIDLPPALKGEDTGPTPPELFIASLGSCIGVYAVGCLTAQGVPCEGIHVAMTWEDGKSPARIGKISADISLPEGISPERARMALRAAEQCKIHNTLHHTPEICISIAEEQESDMVEAAPRTAERD
ncbi:MAG: OsmC family protein [Armatimonadetes bacterium]|nr:OsmC family protein [Armatimonadota bacterium]